MRKNEEYADRANCRRVSEAEFNGVLSQHFQYKFPSYDRACLLRFSTKSLLLLFKSMIVLTETAINVHSGTSLSSHINIHLFAFPNHRIHYYLLFMVSVHLHPPAHLSLIDHFRQLRTNHIMWSEFQSHTQPFIRRFFFTQLRGENDGLWQSRCCQKWSKIVINVVIAMNYFNILLLIITNSLCCTHWA